MGLWDAFRRLTKPYTDEDYLDEDLEEASASRSLFPRRDSRSYTDYAETPAAEEPREKRSFFSAVRGTERSEEPESRGGTAVAQKSMKLMVMKPNRFEDAAGVADNMRARSAIVLNLEETPKEDARRLVDFISGAAYLQNGHIRRIAANTFIVTPPDMDLSGDELSAIGGRDYSPNYFA